MNTPHHLQKLFPNSVNLLGRIATINQIATIFSDYVNQLEHIEIPLSNEYAHVYSTEINGYKISITHDYSNNCYMLSISLVNTDDTIYVCRQSDIHLTPDSIFVITVASIVKYGHTFIEHLINLQLTNPTSIINYFNRDHYEIIMFFINFWSVFKVNDTTHKFRLFYYEVEIVDDGVSCTCIINGSIIKTYTSDNGYMQDNRTFVVVFRDVIAVLISTIIKKISYNS